jgi:HTH-type transcriptional regulator, sugar sensing transcriptional regulator
MNTKPFLNICGAMNHHNNKIYKLLYTLITMDIGLLQEVGLTINESKIYLALLEIGQSLAGTIAEKAKIHRRNVYDSLERLIEKGLVHHIIKSNRKYYEAVSPEKILDLLKEKLNFASLALPELMQKYKHSKSKQEVGVLQGMGGMKTFFEDIIKEKRDLFAIASSGKSFFHLKFFMLSWTKRINQLNLKIKVLWNNNTQNKEEFKNLKNVESKTLPKNFSTPTQLFLYGEKSAILIWSEEPLCILIKSKEISLGFKKYFDFMWKFSN